jgi:hypothetical protein
MAFEKGVSGNPNGRKRGTANKATTAVREAIAAVLAEADATQLATQLNTLTGKDYIDAYVKLAEFITPKLARTSLAAEEQQSGPTKVTIHIGEEDSRESLMRRLLALQEEENQSSAGIWPV